MPTLRDKIEKSLLKDFPKIKPITSETSNLINTFKDNRYGVSFLSHLIYANGYGERGRSTKHPLGLIYDDGTTRFGIGFFRKEQEPENTGHLHIIAPVGDLKTVDAFVKKSGMNCYIRQLTDEQKNQLNELGYETITENSGGKKWHPEAFAEDETFNHRIINLEMLVGKQAYTGKFGQKYRAFERFLENDYEMEFEEYLPSKTSEAEKIIKEHFSWLKNNNKDIGSTFEDYKAVIYNLPSGNNGNDYFAYIGYLKDTVGVKKPVSLLIGERTGEKTASLQVCFTLRNPDFLPNEFGKSYVGGISTYAYAQVLEEMWSAGIKTVDVGGSETEKLDIFKEQTLRAEEAPTCWVAK
ncbi:hypothetical protein JXA85_02065 [Candidatus Woesearchaeota archaeon]|nr:hypothetical protein [Candidatus Woesearchaeota archaeon]